MNRRHDVTIIHFLVDYIVSGSVSLNDTYIRLRFKKLVRSVMYSTYKRKNKEIYQML